jgi:hypothetical protein
MIKMWIIFKFGYILIVLIQILCVQSYNNHKEEIECLRIGNYNQTQYVKDLTEKCHILTNELSSEAIIQYNVKNNLKLQFKIKCGKNGIWKKGEPEETSDKNNSISDNICYKNSKKYYYCFYEKIVFHCEEKQSNVTQFNDNDDDNHKHKHKQSNVTQFNDNHNHGRNHLSQAEIIAIILGLISVISICIISCLIWVIIKYKNKKNLSTNRNENYVNNPNDEYDDIDTTNHYYSIDSTYFDANYENMAKFNENDENVIETNSHALNIEYLEML